MNKGLAILWITVLTVSLLSISATGFACVGTILHPCDTLESTDTETTN